MEKRIVQVYFGTGKGKTTAAIGQCIRAISMDEQVIVIQFLKGKDREDLRCLDQFEENIKVVRFEKFVGNFRDLSPREQEEEKINLQNGFNYAKKVVEIGECDLLILDEILGLIDLGIVKTEDVIHLLETGRESCNMVLTGQNLPEDLLTYVDIASRLESVKDSEKGKL
ncbi:cob(I)yrinic acid a,c-diamide adenosyltransferase [Anaerolentibacter hominis]|uniref:cob(I)yrinic acid a,c-diamide adenosyltransferase n=1 Tax=Anaerolentibacter hominis TaxID=3079009 RepID=UPI0031B89DDB